MADIHIHEFFYRSEGSLQYFEQQGRLPDALYVRTIVYGGSHSMETGSWNLHLQPVILSVVKVTWRGTFNNRNAVSSNFCTTLYTM